MFSRDSTGLAPLDHVLGGGLVRASVVLLAGPPGIGRTSLTLQMLGGLRHSCLYVTTEETQEHVAAQADRLGIASKLVAVLAERDLDKILSVAQAGKAQTIAIDSIQKLHSLALGGTSGSPTQLTKCVDRLVTYAKENDTAIWLVGHVTKANDIAGPVTIEHSVDVTLTLNQGKGKGSDNERIVRCAGKNRFGPSDALGRFELTQRGFVATA